MQQGTSASATGAAAIVLAGLYLALAGRLALPEIAAALVVGSLAAWLRARFFGRAAAPGLRRLSLFRAIAAVPGDATIVLAALLRAGARGTAPASLFRVGDAPQEGPLAAALASIPANTYVVETAGKRWTLHHLVAPRGGNAP